MGHHDGGHDGPDGDPNDAYVRCLARKADERKTPIAPAPIFVTGYLIIWTVFSVAATTAQWALDQAALLSPMLITTSPTIGASLLIAAGVYQLTPFKQGPA
ncbi:MAG: hypothetical protein CM1200mP25_4710 [Acidobacteriota bacterium]|nr:MAG: hypothetical protein CM1200mP25_4710 [Acidobacteriota bacterium]